MPRLAKEGELGTEPDVSEEMLPVGERGGMGAVEPERGVVLS